MARPPYSRDTSRKYPGNQNPENKDQRTQKPRGYEPRAQESRSQESRAYEPKDHEPRFKDKTRFAAKPKPQRAKLPEDVDALYGVHSVLAALQNPKRRFIRLLGTENGLARLIEDGGPLPLEPVIARPEEISKLLTPDAVHQGVYLEARSLPLLALKDMPRDSIIVALDQVTDPHNVGAILRSACAFGVGALITPVRHSPDITAVLAKAASGGLEHVPIVGVTNLGRALTELKDEGFSLIGLDSEASETLGDLKLRAPVVLVLGAEGKGLRQSIRALCDHQARLELPGAIRSLNVSNAAAIALYAVHQALERT